MAVTVFTSGSGSPASTVRVKFSASQAPGARVAPKAALTPGISVSMTLVLVTVTRPVLHTLMV